MSATLTLSANQSFGIFRAGIESNGDPNARQTLNQYESETDDLYSIVSKHECTHRYFVPSSALPQLTLVIERLNIYRSVSGRPSAFALNNFPGISVVEEL